VDSYFSSTSSKDDDFFENKFSGKIALFTAPLIPRIVFFEIPLIFPIVVVLEFESNFTED
jgi:hypothetical protein